ncbi:MAG: SCO family protein [Pyrinomonadaceae bacterium]
MKYALLMMIAAFAFSSCQSGGAANSNSPSTAKRYTLKGKIVSVDKVAKKAKIDHEDIPGFMEAMTMDFPIHEDWVWDELQPGAEIRAELVVDNSAKEPFWLEKIGIVAVANPNQPAPPVNENFAQVGQTVRDFSLTNQDGKRISIKDFRGKALAITFIYARCPLPDYCIKMSTNFSDLANLINKDDALKEKFALLSISFDPENDTPAKLRAYGLGYMGKGATDLGVWQLTVGNDNEVKKIADFFGLRYEIDANDKTQINHSLRTAVIAPDGKVTKIFAGNEWTPAQLLNELGKAKN